MEICVDNLASARNAIDGGAIRLELCSSLNDGGLTPSVGLTKAVVALAKPKGVRVHVLVRPRPGDFSYSEEEVAVMAFDSRNLVEDGGADGVVFGCLDLEGHVDREGCKAIMDSILSIKGNPNVSTTFHRAFDAVRDPSAAAEIIAELGFNRVLTSGQQPTAIEGRELLKKLSGDFKGRLTFLPGGGVSETNLKELKESLKDCCPEFHASAKVKQASQVKFQNEKCRMGPASDDYTIYVASRERVAAMVKILTDSQ